MRIALLTPGFSADERDWCIPALLDLVRVLARDHEVHVFTLRYPHRRGDYQICGATVHAFGGATAGGLRRVPLLARALRALRREHRQAPFDVLHGLWADEPGFLAVLAGRLLGVPAVVSLLGGELVGFPDIGYGGQLSRTNRFLTAQALRHADRVTAGSLTLRALAETRIDADRLVTLPLGVDTAMFTPLPPSPFLLPASSFLLPPSSFHLPPFHLLHVASLVPVKDQATLLRALALVATEAPEVHLHIVGDGPLRSALAAQAEALGLTPHVTFHGDVAHERLPDFYRAADLFVLSSRYESQSLVALEAGACGCALVGTAVGLLPQLLAPDSRAEEEPLMAGCVAGVGDHAALAEAILRLRQAPGDRANAGCSLQRRVAAQYSLQRSAERLVALYEESV